MIRQLLFVLTIGTVLGVGRGSADADPTIAVPQPGIRATDTRLRALLDQAQAASPTFRSLVDRLHHSDVVVYLQCDHFARPGIDGRLSFVSSAGGYRYLLVRVASLPSSVRQIALIGHELQHAVEIADEPAIVDNASLVRAYGRFGTVRRGRTANDIELDSRAATDRERLVLKEMIAATEDD